MFAKLFIVALAVVCASARDVYPLAYTGGLVPPYPYSAPVAAYSTYSSDVPSVRTYSTYSSSPLSYNTYSAPVVASPFYYGRSVLV